MNREELIFEIAALAKDAEAIDDEQSGHAATVLWALSGLLGCGQAHMLAEHAMSEAIGEICRMSAG